MKVANRILPSAIRASATICLLGLMLLLPSSASGASLRWVNPIGDGPFPTVVAAFDPPPEPWLAGHRGVDLAASPGDQVSAAGGGTVTFSGLVAGRGVVTVSHGELRTTYEPVDSPLAAGSIVTPGQALGSISTGGHCSNRCLHWGLRRGDDYLDPMLLLRWEPPVLKRLNVQADQRTARRTIDSQAAAVANVDPGLHSPTPLGPAHGLATAAVVSVGGAVIGVRRLRRR